MNKSYERFLCVILLLAFFALATENAREASITVDEGLHIASGYTILVTGDYRLVEEHPPLIKLWMALPLLPLSDLADPTTLSAWDTSQYTASESIPLLRMAQQLLFTYLPVEQWLLPARVMCIGIGMLLLSLLYRWTTHLWGKSSGLLVLALAAFDPNIIAHSAIAGTDIGAAFFILLSLWLSSKLITTQKKYLIILTGIAMGLAFTSKLTAVLVILPFGYLGINKYLKQTRAEQKQSITNLFVLVIIIFLTMWGIYSFQVDYIAGIPLPLPMTAHATPLLRLIQHASGGHQAYLFGDNSLDGWWYYFPLAFLVKTPIPVLLLFPLAIAMSVRNSQWHKPQSIITVLFFIVYTATSLASPLNIGYRHILPLLFLIYLWLGACIKPQKTWGQILCYLLVLYQISNTTYHSPYLLGWFNDLSGGLKNGWRYLADSNTDWGQGYKALSRYQSINNIPTMHLAGFVFYDPAIYDLDYSPLPPTLGHSPAILPTRFAPPPGHYAISLSSLDGVPLADNEMYDWFRWRPPTDRIANAINYYQVTQEDVETNWVAQCTNPVTSLRAEVVSEGFGNDASRRYIPFDCTQSWIIPNLPAGSGSYILHGSHFENNLAAKLHYNQPKAWDRFINAHLQHTEVIYHQRQYHDSPAFALFRAQSPHLIQDRPERTIVLAAPAVSPPLQTNDRIEVNTPVAFDGPLDFLGISVNKANQILEVETWWRVNQTMAEIKSLSIMAHILSATGENLGVADGLGISPYDWLIGDVIIQRHRFTLNTASSTNGFLFRTGLYWHASGERMQLIDAAGVDALYVLIDK